FIEFHVTDKEVLINIKKVTLSQHKIAVRTRNPKHKTGYRLQIGSKEIFNDLTNLGFTPAKSLELKFPNVPEEVFGDFVRGYFDGDGCIYFKQHFRKDRNRLEWFMTSRFTCGNKRFLEILHAKLGNFTHKGFIYKKQRSGYELVFSRKDSLALFHLMYNNIGHGLFLTRKYVKFKKAIKTLYGNLRA
ncbi:MAG: LAGLIDADG family homing endonuclease, partial [Patescibacteria group bacterium]